mmetsp:Transcript_64710/g.202648  ORF Transcript_64710/g.202648 Transcript_64710/m.202648 type:complete len:205 (-) Transcript_64710:2084-2698(-)
MRGGTVRLLLLPDTPHRLAANPVDGLVADRATVWGLHVHHAARRALEVLERGVDVVATTAIQLIGDAEQFGHGCMVRAAASWGKEDVPLQRRIHREEPLHSLLRRPLPWHRQDRLLQSRLRTAAGGRPGHRRGMPGVHGAGGPVQSARPGDPVVLGPLRQGGVERLSEVVAVVRRVDARASLAALVGPHEGQGGHVLRHVRQRP